MRFSLRQLEVFIAAAQFENISRAAESLAMSQSAASGALKELERHYDVQLFDRVGKRLKLNEQGTLFKTKAHALLDHAKKLESELLNHQEVGCINVGATLTIGNYIAIKLINRFKQRHPSAKVVLDIGNTDDIAHKVLNLEFDVGLIEGEYQHEDLVIMPWQEDDLCIFCSPQHPLAKKRTITDKHLIEAKWILRENGSGTRQTFNRAMSGIYTDLSIEFELQQTEAIKQAVEQNLGIACLSDVSLVNDFKSKTFY